MKILLVTNYQPPHMGGIEFAAGSLKRCWEKSGHKVTWMSTDIPCGARKSAEDNIRIPAANYFERWWQVNSPIVSLLAYPEIVRQIRAHDVVNIHSLAPGLATLTLYAALRRKWPTVATQHVGVIPMRNRLLNTLQEKFICSIARWCVANSVPLTFVGAAVSDWFLEHAHIPADRIVMTPAGIDQKDFYFVPGAEREPLRKKWGLNADRLNLLFVGRFYEKKGIPLIKEMAALCPDLNFTLVGHGPCNPVSWNLPNIRVIKFVSTAELRELYGSHDLFIMPSIGEGWPAVIPQAMACGLPCLISEETFQGYGKDREQFIVCHRNAALLKETIMSIAVDLKSLSLRREEISKYACAHWDWEITAQIYIGLFEKLLTS